MLRLLPTALLGVLAVLAGMAACGGVRPSSTTFRVMVFNIHAGKDAGRTPNLEDVAALVRSTDADLVLLQEVDRATNRSAKVDQLAVLMDRTRYAGVFGRSLDYDGGLYGIAALARAGFISHETMRLPVEPAQARAGGAYEPRVALAAVARTASGPVRVLNTHLDASGDDRYRMQEVARIVTLASMEPAAGPAASMSATTAASRRLPLLVAGDFNAEPGSPVIGRVLAAGLRDAWAECGAGDGFTYPSHAPVKRIDYLFLDGTLTCADARVIETTISDHRPLLVTVVRVAPRISRVRLPPDRVSAGPRPPPPTTAAGRCSG